MAKLIPSISRLGNPYDNAGCESFLKTLKRQEIYPNDYHDLEQLVESVEAFIEDYCNQCRLHSALGYRSPEEREKESENRNGGASFGAAEEGHVIPSIETLEKPARAPEVPLFALFYEREEPRALPDLPKRKAGSEARWGSFGKEAWLLSKLRCLLSDMDHDDRRLLLQIAQKMATRNGAK